jgi:hypothetical protein
MRRVALFTLAAVALAWIVWRVFFPNWMIFDFHFGHGK